MLSPTVYRELYRLACDAPDLDIIEIGGAAGAGSIALALGMKESGKQSGIIVAEKLEGGSRLELGDRASNRQIIEENFRKFGVLDQVRFFPHEVTMENGGKVSALVRSGEIAALIHDADGRVDRDFFCSGRFYATAAPLSSTITPMSRPSTGRLHRAIPKAAPNP